LTLRTSLPHRTSVVLAHDCLAVDLCYVAGFRSRWTIPLADVADVRLVRHLTPMAQETEGSLSVVTSLLVLERSGARHHWDLHDPDGRLYPKGGELAIRSALYPRLWSSQSGSSAIDPSTTSAA
jgi:hypothetical protein